MKLQAIQSFLLSCTLLSSCYSVSQEGAKSGPPVAQSLALSSRAAARWDSPISVLTWMEEHRIPVSYVAGTSMGGLVGGIYATGRSPAEVRELINGIDWDQVLSGVTPFRDLSFRRKQDAHDVPGQLEFGLRGGLAVSFRVQHGPGSQSGSRQCCTSLLRDPSFNDLPIPFACVATDLVSGKRHVFRDGSLSLAMRSTMSLPGIFTPVRSGNTSMRMVSCSTIFR